MRIRLTQTLTHVPVASGTKMGRVFEAERNQHCVGYGDVNWFIVGDDGTVIGVRGFEAMQTLEPVNVIIQATVDIQYMLKDFEMERIPKDTLMLATDSGDVRGIEPRFQWYTLVQGQQIGIFESEAKLWQPQ